MSKEDSRKFRNSYGITYSSSKGIQYNPNEVFAEIERRKAEELSALVHGTGNEHIIAFRDPKVRELVDFVMAAIIMENKRIIPPEAYFPIKISRRYKSIDSLTHKMEKFDDVTDYLGFKIIPESEHDILYSMDPVLQEMIDRRESIRKFVAEKFRKLSRTRKTTFASYCQSCTEILDKLQEAFTDKTLGLFEYKDADSIYASERKKYYEEQKETLAQYLKQYEATSENPDEKLSIYSIIDITGFDIKELLIELQNNMSNEITLYQLTNNLYEVIARSALLSTLGVSIANDSTRTRLKFKPNRL